MTNRNFTVIRGGLLDSAKTSKKTFKSAYVTNTRLMGVLGMHIHWKLPDNHVLSDLHQFFYFDAEEYGFETYESILGDFPDSLSDLEGSLIGGLGGEKISISLKEAKFILKEYAQMNMKFRLPLPDSLDEYNDLLAQPVELTMAEKYNLINKICVKIETPYELINYFLMRCFGRDFTGAAYLADKAVTLDVFSDLKAATFCSNDIDEAAEANTFVSESLIELDDCYYITVTKVKVIDMQIASYERISAFKVSPSEAAMRLTRSEFVTVFEMLTDPLDFCQHSTKLTRDAMVHEHETGRLYIIFHPNNKHVGNKRYRLNEDVLGMYFISNSGQLISASYSLDLIKKLEFDLGTSLISKKLIPVSKYEFQEPVLYEFIQSGFEDFEDFVDAIKTGED